MNLINLHEHLDKQDKQEEWLDKQEALQKEGCHATQLLQHRAGNNTGVM